MAFRSPDDRDPPRVRFSTEIAQRASTGLTDPSRIRPSLEIRVENPPVSSSAPASAARSPISPLSPISPRQRNRGHSLRRQLFFRNAGQQQQLGGVGSGAQGRSSSSGAAMELGRIQSPPTDSLEGEELDDKALHSHPRGKGVGAVLGERLKWPIQAVDGIRNGVVALKKRIAKAQEIPPSKEGRKIPIDPERKEPLVDERRKGNYLNNTIRSSRYTLWTFLPRQLFAQFSKLANFYFLCVSILQMIPNLSTTGTYTTIVPVMFFITLSMSKEGYDDYRRYKMDKVENNRDAEAFDLKQPPSEDGAAKRWKTTKWRDVKVGDVLKLVRDDWVPADLLLLHSEGENGIAYVETTALDGETNLKSKQTIPLISELCDTEETLPTFRADFVVEDPNMDLYNFEGKVTIDGATKPLTNGQVIYRGSILRNTPTIYALVIFTGEETKIRMNANKNPRTKAPRLQWLVNRIIIVILAFVIVLAIFNTVAYQIWRPNTEHKSWYLNEISVAFFPIFASYIIMFNTLIPVSLYVSLEIVKLGQMFLLNDIDMYHEESDTPFEAHTSTINEDCGQISYIFSDKTGTLTDNSMLFRKMSIVGHAWLHDVDIQKIADQQAGRIKLLHKKRKGKGKVKGKDKDRLRKASKRVHSEQPNTRKSFGDLASSRAQKNLKKMSLDGILNRQSSSRSTWRASANPARLQPQLSTRDLLEYLQHHPHTLFARKARFFLLSIALCHTCLPEVDEEEDTIDYQAASPDELALVRAAQELGYICIDREMGKITIQTFPNGLQGEPMAEVYETLEVIEFSSKRKRMSIVVRLPNGKICIFCKGADSTIIELLRLRELAVEKSREVERRASIRRSIEAQEVIRRNSTHRSSMGGRSSFGGPSRPSMTLNRLKPIKDELDDWARGKENDLDASSLDDESLYSRPSAQFGNRHSIAFGEVPNSPLERDTSDDIVDESLALDDARVFERCFVHVNHFASEGLRTLLYAHRFVEEHEYSTWKKIYAEATTSLVDRKAQIERAAELIERDLELTGATAIEDKLQVGVPEAIDKLRRARIRLWMLTGDKRETAINIGHSCRLIKDYSTVTVLDDQDIGLGKTMRSAIADISAGNVAHSVVVVDGGTLATIDSDMKLKQLFFDLAVCTDSVICCRASPSQKASLVKTIRTKVQKSVTLAIGDGANDIAMIQEAHVGVGITGKEGLQAARVSDYSMAQFRFLLKFLLVHGRWNYVRTCKYVLSTFWKEMLFYLTQALFQRWNGYTGSSLYEPWSLSMFNTLFTSLPVIFMGVFEKDLAASTLLAVPELYRKGQDNDGFSFKIYLGWMFVGSTQAMITFFMMYSLYAPTDTVDQAVFALGTLTYSVCVTVISCKIQLVEMHNKSILAAISMFCSIGGWFLWNIILCETYAHNTIHNVAGGLLTRFGKDLNWWLVYIFSVSACLIFDVSLITIRTTFWPTDVDTFQEIEQSREMRKRLEEAASDELQQGWHRGKKKSSTELRQVQELLDRPREMEEGTASKDESEKVDEIMAKRFGSVKRVKGRE